MFIQMDSIFKPLMKLSILLGMISTGFICSDSAFAETYLTKTFRVEIQRHCQEGFVTCDDVSYIGVNLQTGAKIQLEGSTLHTTCKDGVTPCRFLGYVFYNGSYSYQLINEYLVVSRSGKEIFREKAKILY